MSTNNNSQTSDVQPDGQHEQPYLTYRQKRRLDRAQRNGPKRGKTRGLKYISSRENEKNKKERPYAKISDDLRCVVGPNAGRFICELSLWVKEFCPPNSMCFKRIDNVIKERLLNKIKAKWNLPLVVGDQPIDFALLSQCVKLYRAWRFRLKEEHFTGFSKRQAEANKPNEIGEEEWKWLICHWSSKKQQHISETNRKSRLKQKSVPANGSLSTARIFYDMANAPPGNHSKEPNEDPNAEESDETIPEPEEPLYVRLYERTKRHKDGSWDDETEANYNQLRELHASEVEKHGEDKLTVKEAYAQVLKEIPGYVRGLAHGPRPLKRARNGEWQSEVQEQLVSEIQQIHDAFSLREDALLSKIHNLEKSNDELKSSNEELKSSNEKLRASNEELREANQLLRGDMACMRLEILERENKFKAEVMRMIQASR